MTVTELPSAVDRVLAQLTEAVDAAAAIDPDGLSWAAQERLVRAADLLHRRVEALRLRALEAFARSGGWDDGTHLSAAAWVRDELQVARGEAGRDLALGRVVAQWPAVAKALAAGEISARAAGVLCSALSRLPEVDDDLVTMLLAAAKVWDPLELARALAARVGAGAARRRRDLRAAAALPLDHRRRHGSRGCVARTRARRAVPRCPRRGGAARPVGR